eukprot:712362-Hanusia_phi.AAC.1
MNTCGPDPQPRLPGSQAHAGPGTVRSTWQRVRSAGVRPSGRDLYGLRPRHSFHPGPLTDGHRVGPGHCTVRH